VQRPSRAQHPTFELSGNDLWKRKEAHKWEARH
jgi:hypothetical protein